MNHSTWDLEVYARDLQQRRFHEADQARQISAARQHGNQRYITAPRFTISRLIAAVRNCLAPRPSSVPAPRGYAEAPALAGTTSRSLPGEKPALIPDVRPAGLSQPYSGMMILARGTSAQSSPQPCAAGDC